MPETVSESRPLPFEIDDRIDPSLVTAHAGVPLVIDLFRRLGAAQVVNAQMRIKQRQRGLPSAQLVETPCGSRAGTAVRTSRGCVQMPHCRLAGL